MTTSSDSERERVIDARVMRRLATDSAYRNAESAEAQQQREDEITAEEEERYGALPLWFREGYAADPADIPSLSVPWSR